jgi:hypothetical protein
VLEPVQDATRIGEDGLDLARDKLARGEVERHHFITDFDTVDPFLIPAPHQDGCIPAKTLIGPRDGLDVPLRLPEGELGFIGGTPRPDIHERRSGFLLYQG